MKTTKRDKAHNLYNGIKNTSNTVDADNVPVQEHLKLLNGWVTIAGETHGEACAAAWSNVKRQAQKLHDRAGRYESTWMH